MAKKKKSATESEPAPSPPKHSAAYEEAVAQYAAALDLLHKGEYAEARKRFLEAADVNPDEAVLAERARAHASICARKLEPASPAPTTAEDNYYAGVVLSNEGKITEALVHLDRAVQMDPSNARFLYGRAAARAMEGNAPAAAADLRLAIAAESHLRFQASTDSAFDKVRDEAVFIDVIEPTPTGA